MHAPIPQRLTTWTRARLRLAAIFAGALSILAMAPFFLWPILWLTLPGLLLLVAASEARTADPVSRFAPWQRRRIGRAAETGWWFGFGYHVAGLFWIGEAFLVEAEVFAWLLPFAVTGLPAGLALFTAAACAFTAWAAPLPYAADRAPPSAIPEASSPQTGDAHPGPSPLAVVHTAEPGNIPDADRAAARSLRDTGAVGWPRVFALAIGFGVTEWLRGNILTGLPWNVLGYALTAPGLMQLASVFGIYGLTLIAVLVFALPAAHFADSLRQGATACASFAVALLALSFGLSFPIPNGYGLDPPCKVLGRFCSEPIVRLVQPSVPQREKWRPENQRAIFDDHLALSQIAIQLPRRTEGISLIVWPEAAMPFFPLNEPVALAEIGRMLPEGVTLATGALRADPPTSPGERRRVYNSLLLFGRGEPTAEVRAIYDKTHLVPFGEYLPLQRVLEAIGLQQLSRMRGGFAAGAEPRALIDVAGVGKLAPLICYETIFPRRVIQSRERPRALLVVTNDGWFGNTTGPRQHLHMARVRAAEEGVPVIRAANNGISAMIDAYGGITARLDLNVRGAVDARLPPVIEPPVYARFGEAIFLALLSGLALPLMGLRRRALTQSTNDTQP